MQKYPLNIFQIFESTWKLQDIILSMASLAVRKQTVVGGMQTSPLNLLFLG